MWSHWYVYLRTHIRLWSLLYLWAMFAQWVLAWSLYYEKNLGTWNHVMTLVVLGCRFVTSLTLFYLSVAGTPIYVHADVTSLAYTEVIYKDMVAFYARWWRWMQLDLALELTAWWLMPDIYAASGLCLFVASTCRALMWRHMCTGRRLLHDARDYAARWTSSDLTDQQETAWTCTFWILFWSSMATWRFFKPLDPSPVTMDVAWPVVYEDLWVWIWWPMLLITMDSLVQRTSPMLESVDDVRWTLPTPSSSTHPKALVVDQALLDAYGDPSVPVRREVVWVRPWWARLWVLLAFWFALFFLYWGWAVATNMFTTDNDGYVAWRYVASSISLAVSILVVLKLLLRLLAARSSSWANRQHLGDCLYELAPWMVWNSGASFLVARSNPSDPSADLLVTEGMAFILANFLVPVVWVLAFDGYVTTQASRKDQEMRKALILKFYTRYRGEGGFTNPPTSPNQGKLTRY